MAAIAMATKEMREAFLVFMCHSLLKICVAEFLFVEKRIRAAQARAARPENELRLNFKHSTEAACAAVQGAAVQISCGIQPRSGLREGAIGVIKFVKRCWYPPPTGRGRELEDKAATGGIAIRVLAAAFSSRPVKVAGGVLEQVCHGILAVRSGECIDHRLAPAAHPGDEPEYDATADFAAAGRIAAAERSPIETARGIEN